MKPIRLNLSWSRTLLAAFAALGLAACGGGSGGGTGGAGDALDGGSAGVNFSLQLEGARNSANASKAMTVKAESGEGEHGAESSDDGGTVITLSEVRVHIRDVEFYLPEGMRCEDVQFTFVDPVRCDNDDDADEADGVDDDDGTPDQGPGDFVKNSEGGDDDGTPDQGPGEVPGEDDDEDDNNGIDDEDKVVVEGPFIADLINGTSTPSLTTLLIPSGLYTRIDVRIDEADEGEGLLTAGDPLLGRSLYARGSFDYQGTSHELRIRLKFSEDIRFENKAGIEVLETGANDVVLSLDENAWFKGINLVACLDAGDLTLESDGSLVIDEDTGEDECGDLENRIKENVEASGSGFRDDEDDDNDGVDDDEDDDDDNDGVDDDDESDDDDGTPDQGPGDL